MTRLFTCLPKRTSAALMPALLSLLFWGTAALQADPVLSLQNKSPKRVLFVGNSYFYYNDSLHNHVKRIVEELRPDLAESLQYKSATIGGAALSHHALDSLLTPGKLGIDDSFDLVIFQGGSAEVLTDRRRKTFFEMARSHANKARATGAEVAFYMTHAYVPPHKRAEPGMINTIASSYVTAGEQNKALVIPVGYAFELSYAMKPDLALHKHFDGSHPSLYGTYLAACVVYLSVYGGSLDGLEYTYFGEVPEDIALHLQTVATATVNKFLKSN